MSEAGFCRNSPNLNHEGGITAPGRFPEPSHTSSNSCTKLAHAAALGLPAAHLQELRAVRDHAEVNEAPDVVGLGLAQLLPLDPLRDVDFPLAETLQQEKH